jgi:hypothetical protein
MNTHPKHDGSGLRPPARCFFSMVKGGLFFMEASLRDVGIEARIPGVGHWWIGCETIGATVPPPPFMGAHFSRRNRVATKEANRDFATIQSFG